MRAERIARTNVEALSDGRMSFERIRMAAYVILNRPEVQDQLRAGTGVVGSKYFVIRLCDTSGFHRGGRT